MLRSEPEVLIVGAGISGIGMAVHLTEKCPGKGYAVLERRNSSWSVMFRALPYDWQAAARQADATDTSMRKRHGNWRYDN